MNKKQVINSIINFPEDFYREGNISVYSILKKTGYFELSDQISESDIRQLIAEKGGGKIEKWILWSENKRTNSGWFFKKKDEKYVVGHFDINEGYSNQIEYSSPIDACANFIKHELEGFILRNQ